MFGLKIFVQVQTFRRGPPVPPHNFCHPALSQCNVLQDDDFFLPWSIVCYTWPHPPLPRAWNTSWKIVSLVRQPGISRLTACAPPLLHVQLMKQPKKGVPKNSTFLKYQVSEISERCTLFSGTPRMCFRHQQWSQWNPMESAPLKTSACAT